MSLWTAAVAAIMGNTAVTSSYLAFLEDQPPKPPLAEGEEAPPEPEVDPDAPPDVFDYKSKQFKYLVSDEKHDFMLGKVRGGAIFEGGGVRIHLQTIACPSLGERGHMAPQTGSMRGTRA